MALKDPLDPLVFQGKKVRLESRVPLVKALKALLVSQDPRASLVTQGLRALLAPAETLGCRGPMVRKA